MSRNEAAERLREWLANGDGRMYMGDLDEALATERRLTVERVWLRIYRDTEIQVRGADRLRSILDDLATADVDEEAGA